MPARKSRLSLGDLMILIALGAIYAAPFLNGPYRLASNIPTAVIGCLGLAVTVTHRRLSPWMWVLIAGQAGGSLFRLGRHVLRYDGLPPPPVFLLESCLVPFVYIFGLGMTFRDVRRRLAALEDRVAARPDDGRSA